ncbi:DUF6758 family protein [Nocardioides marmorisolisilvae]|uniref:Uncharacterized protein n=1 Tax=Nocardioides marmorisolisilvae TaxID=1542737 RepID=A0A3N0DNQ5_9ACTN|nr:hypothetical protein EFL95_17640 [Nocardioides marmorisolisilvae]
MSLAASCPRCTAPITEGDGAWTCSVHGSIHPLWRPQQASYESFAELVNRAADDLPTYLPWPMSPGWSIADFGCVANTEKAFATVTTTVGTSDLDGPVEVTVISEDPGVGLGSRCAGTAYDDPGEQIGLGPHAIHVRAGGRTVPMWTVDPSIEDDLFAKSVFAGEADGRWLWLVIRPASAALLLRDEWLLADVTGFGPEALEMPFGGARPTW